MVYFFLYRISQALLFYILSHWKKQPVSFYRMKQANVVTDENNQYYLRHYIPRRSAYCKFCKALMWTEERLVCSSIKNPLFGLCCQSGAVNIPLLSKKHEDVYNLLSPQSKHFSHFTTNVRYYNNLLAFTSMNCQLDKAFMSKKGSGSYNFRISGSVHHLINHPMATCDKPKFSQIYILDPDDQLVRRMEIANQCDQVLKEEEILRKEILETLQAYLHLHNPYVHVYKQISEMTKNQKTIDLKIILKNPYAHVSNSMLFK